MSQIPSTTRFIGISDTVNLTEKKSSVLNSETQPYTMQDIADTARPYKVYSALLYQDGINDPTANILENTLGFDVNWERQGTGAYFGYFSIEQYDTSKFFVLSGFQNPGGAPNNGKISTIDFFYLGISIQTVALDMADPNAGDFNYPIIDGVLWQTPIEIRVYN